MLLKNIIRKILKEELSEIVYMDEFANQTYGVKTFSFLKNKIDENNELQRFKLGEYDVRMFEYYGQVIIVVYEQNEPFLIMVVIKFKDGVKVDEIRSLKNKTGIGTKLYNKISELFGALYSDGFQYLAAKKIWEKLITEYPDRISAFNTITNEEFEIIKCEDNNGYCTENGDKIYVVQDSNEGNRKSEKLILKLKGGSNKT